MCPPLPLHTHTHTHTQPVELYRGLAALAAWRHCPGPEWQAAMLRQLAAKLADMPTWQVGPCSPQLLAPACLHRPTSSLLDVHVRCAALPYDYGPTKPRTPSSLPSPAFPLPPPLPHLPSPTSSPPPPTQLPQVVRHLADVGASPPLPLLNALVAGAVAGRVAGAADLALLVTGLARLGRQVSPRLLASLLAELNALSLAPEVVGQQQQEAGGGQRGRGRVRSGGGGGRTPTDSVEDEEAVTGGGAGGAAQQAQQAQQGLARGRAAGGSGSAVDVLGLQLLLDTAWALAALRYTPAALWVAGCLAAVEPRLPALTPQQLEAALAAAAHLRYMTGGSTAAAAAAAGTAAGATGGTAAVAAGGKDGAKAVLAAAPALVRPGPGRAWLAAAEARLRVLQSEADVEARAGHGPGGPGPGPGPEAAIAASLQDVDLEAAVAGVAGASQAAAVPVAGGDTGSGALLFVATPAVQAGAAQEVGSSRRGGSRGGRWGCLPGAWRALRDAQGGQQ